MNVGFLLSVSYCLIHALIGYVSFRNFLYPDEFLIKILIVLFRDAIGLF